MQLLSVQLIEGCKNSCENCGHLISWIYTIEIDGNIRRVGSECAALLLGPSTTDRMGKRAKRAATQWRKQTPPALLDETREQYISRRVTEMGNAMNAHRVWTALNFASMFGKLNRWLTKRGCKKVVWDVYFQHLSRKIGKKYNANPFDFNRSTWDVAKV